MNVAKIPILLVVLWSLFSVIPSYAATSSLSTSSPATVSEDNSTGNSTLLGNNSEAVYSIVANVRDPVINPGDTVEIEVYVSGYGVPEKNRLVMTWSSPKVIDEKEPGNITYLADYDINTNTAKWGNFPLGLTPGNITDISGAPAAWLVLRPVIFEAALALLPPPEEFPGTGLKMVMGETNWNDMPPVLIELKTRKDAPPGDYGVKLTFTYGNETNLKQDFKVAEFHIRSMLWGISRENWQLYAGISGGVTAWLALMITAGKISRRSRQGSAEGKGKGRLKGSR